MRKAVLLALSAVFAVVVGALLPGAAAAEETAAPERTMTAVDVGAAALEVNYAVAGSLPPRSELSCHWRSAVEICYEAYGDRWWVQDQDADGASAAVHWFNYRSGSLYRTGLCVNSLGNGEWGQCNKNYYENSTLYGNPCTWDRSESSSADCWNDQRRFQ